MKRVFLGADPWRLVVLELEVADVDSLSGLGRGLAEGNPALLDHCTGLGHQAVLAPGWHVRNRESTIAIGAYPKLRNWRVKYSDSPGNPATEGPQFPLQNAHSILV